MNIVVAMKQIPDIQQIRIRNRQPVFEDVPLTFGNIDKNALEAGVTLKEIVEARLTVVAAGNEELEDTIKEALAAGADDAFLVIDKALDRIGSETSASLIAAALQKIGNVDIVLFGEGSGDNYSGQVPSRVAEILNLPEVGYVKAIELDGRVVRVTRVLEDCEEYVEAELPVVITVVSDINEIRIPSVTQILKAGKKSKEITTPDELGIDLAVMSKVTTLSNLAPETNRKRIEVKSIDELVKALSAEGLVRR